MNEIRCKLRVAYMMQIMLTLWLYSTDLLLIASIVNEYMVILFD